MQAKDAPAAACSTVTFEVCTGNAQQCQSQPRKPCRRIGIDAGKACLQVLARESLRLLEAVLAARDDPRVAVSEDHPIPASLMHGPALTR